MNRPELKDYSGTGSIDHRQYSIALDEYINHLESQLKDQEGKKIKKHLKPQHFLLPTDEEIYSKKEELYELYYEGRRSVDDLFTDLEKWLKSQIKGIPKELVDELRDSLFDAVQALKWWQDEYPQGEGKVVDDKIKKFEDLIQYLTEKEQV